MDFQCLQNAFVPIILFSQETLLYPDTLDVVILV